MRRTVSESRIPEYPTVSVDSDEVKTYFVNACQNLDLDEIEEESYRVRYISPFLIDGVFDKIGGRSS